MNNKLFLILTCLWTLLVSIWLGINILIGNISGTIVATICTLINFNTLSTAIKLK
jgi:hypothetical protein